MTFPIRIGIIGIGDSSKHGHLPALKLLPEYKLSAIYSKRRDAAEMAAAEYGITYVVKTLDELVWSAYTVDSPRITATLPTC
jgi:predicted dehydrogenase